MFTVRKSAKLIAIIVEKSMKWVSLPLNEFLFTEQLTKDTLWDAVVNAVDFLLAYHEAPCIINIGLFPDNETDMPSYEMNVAAASDVVIPLHYTKVIELPGRLEKLLITNATE